MPLTIPPSTIALWPPIHLRSTDGTSPQANVTHLCKPQRGSKGKTTARYSFVSGLVARRSPSAGRREEPRRVNRTLEKVSAEVQSQDAAR